jgi:hypothetical protein
MWDGTGREVRVWPMGVGSSEDVGEVGEAEAGSVERVEGILQRPVTVLGLYAGFPQVAVGADRAGVEVVGDVSVGNGA